MSGQADELKNVISVSVGDVKPEVQRTASCFLCHRPNLIIEFTHNGKDVCQDCAEILMIASVTANDVATEQRKIEKTKNEEARRKDNIKNTYGKECA